MAASFSPHPCFFGIRNVELLIPLAQVKGQIGITVPMDRLRNGS